MIVILEQSDEHLSLRLAACAALQGLLAPALAAMAGACSKLGVSAVVQPDSGEKLQALALPACGGGRRAFAAAQVRAGWSDHAWNFRRGTPSNLNGAGPVP